MPSNDLASISLMFYSIGAHFIWKYNSAKKCTWNATYLGSFGTHSGFILYILENWKTSLFGDVSQHTYILHSLVCPNLANFSACVPLASQKGCFFYFPICRRWSLNGSWMSPGGWRFMLFFFCWIILSNEVWGIRNSGLHWVMPGWI